MNNPDPNNSAGSPVNQPLALQMQGIYKSFFGVPVLKNVDFDVYHGEVHVLLGENGAGKSTLMNIVYGLYHADEGEIYAKGERVLLRSPRDAISHGVGMVHQHFQLVPVMTVTENVMLGSEIVGFGGVLDERKAAETVAELSEQYGLVVDPSAVIEELPVGVQQRVEILKALYRKADILILDEPTSALSEAEVDKLMEILQTLKKLGVTCIYISHKLEEFFRITDTVSVLRDGKVVTTKPTKELSLEKLVSLMVGREMKERFPKGNRKPGEVIFKVDGLKALDPNDPSREVLKGVSFELRKGEILGIAGLMGSGRTELVTTIFGEYGLLTAGTLTLDGKEIKIGSARDAMSHGISLVPEDRKGQGLVLIQTILKNISLPNLDRFSSFMRINGHAEIAEAEKFSKSLSIKAPSVHVAVESLSGGNQQKVVISKWLMSEPRILILDDPTRGIDVGAKYEIYKLINQLAENGYSIIMISSELEEVLGMSDRVMVMWEGRSNGTLGIAQASQEKVMARATGIEIA